MNNPKKKDTINLEQLEYLKSGLNLVFEHTDQLLKDSELLLKKKRYSTSIPLSIIAIEEVGKSNFLESLIKLKKPITNKFWKEITRGGIAHVKKTTSLILAEKNFLDSLSQKQNLEGNRIMEKMGIPVTDNKMLKIGNMLRKATYLRLESLKHDCLYVNRDGKTWTNFSNRFTTHEQLSIAHYLFIIALRTHTSHKFSLSIPQKPFKEYSKEDIKKSKSKWNKESKPIMKKTYTKKLGRLIDHGMLLLHNNYPADKRGYVTEKPSGWLDLDF